MDAPVVQGLGLCEVRVLAGVHARGEFIVVKSLGRVNEKSVTILVHLRLRQFTKYLFTPTHTSSPIPRLS